jgi:hypothetical protein
MGYHRLHTHRSYRVPKWLEYFFAVCGTLTLEGGPIFWVATHRVHHQNSDQNGDPHSPHDGGFWAHMGWIIFGERKHNNTELMARYAPDLAKDRFYLWLNTYHYVPLIVLGLILLATGGVRMVLWGVALRVVVRLHATWLVNSATHMWGNRRFATRDDSRNSWWVALLTFGEDGIQSSRASDVGAARADLVRAGHHVAQIRPTVAADRAEREGSPGHRRRAAARSRLKVRLGTVAYTRACRVETFSTHVLCGAKLRASAKSADAARTGAHATALFDFDSPFRDSGRMAAGGHRKSIAFFITLGACLVALAVALQVGWVVLNWRTGYSVLGVLFSF